MNRPTKPSSKTPVSPANAETMVVAARSRLSSGVRAVITRRATAAGMCDVNYFREIIAGRAPRITRLEAAREPLPLPSTP